MLRMSRAELHELIWSKPMTEIARSMAFATSMLHRRAMPTILRAPALAIGKG